MKMNRHCKGLYLLEIICVGNLTCINFRVFDFAIVMCGHTFEYFSAASYVPERCFSATETCEAPPEPSTDAIKSSHIDGRGHEYVGGDSVW